MSDRDVQTGNQGITFVYLLVCGWLAIRLPERVTEFYCPFIRAVYDTTVLCFCWRSTKWYATMICFESLWSWQMCVVCVVCGCVGLCLCLCVCCDPVFGEAVYTCAVCCLTQGQHRRKVNQLEFFPFAWLFSVWNTRQ